MNTLLFILRVGRSIIFEFILNESIFIHLFRKCSRRWVQMESDISKSFNVTGYVQNLNSGEVEMLLEGKKNDVIRMAKEIERSLKVFTSVKKKNWVTLTSILFSLSAIREYIS